MKTLLVILFMAPLVSFSQSSDEDQVKQVVTSAYIDGIQNRGSIEDIRKGFHPAFNMLRLNNNEIKPFPLKSGSRTSKRPKPAMNLNLPRRKENLLMLTSQETLPW